MKKVLEGLIEQIKNKLEDETLSETTVKILSEIKTELEELSKQEWDIDKIDELDVHLVNMTRKLNQLNEKEKS